MFIHVFNTTSTKTRTLSLRKNGPPKKTDPFKKPDLKALKRCHLSHVIWNTMLKWFIFIQKVGVYKASLCPNNVLKVYYKFVFWKSWYKNENCQFATLISMKSFRMFTHFCAALFSIKTCFYETSSVFYLKC